MNKEIEFRRLRWLLTVQHFLQREKEILMVDRLIQVNSEETALELNNNELARLLDTERRILDLSHTYDFTDEPSREEVRLYVMSMIGVGMEKGMRW